MKNSLNYPLFIALTFGLFCCNKPEEPKPLLPEQIPTMAGMRSGAEISSDVQDTSSFRSQVNTGYKWHFVKTVQLQLNNSLTLKSPYTQAAYPAGDISWRTDGGCYSALSPTKNVSFVSLGFVDIAAVTLQTVKALNFKPYQIAAAPEGSQTWTNYLPVNTVIACKTATGRYFLLEVKFVGIWSHIELDIYQGLYTI